MEPTIEFSRLFFMASLLLVENIDYRIGKFCRFDIANAHMLERQYGQQVNSLLKNTARKSIMVPNRLNGLDMAKKKNAKPKPDQTGTQSLAVNGVVPGKFVAIPLDYSSAEEQQAIFANAFVVQHDEHEFHLLFFQTLPPLILGNDPLRGEKIKSLKSIKPQCVARIAIAGDRLQSVIDALKENLSRYQSKASIAATNVNAEATLSNAKPTKRLQ